jgi:hypothetical protein
MSNMILENSLGLPVRPVRVASTPALLAINTWGDTQVD